MGKGRTRFVGFILFAALLCLPAFDAFSCDTYVALGNSTTDGNVIFVKSSNRSSEEAMRFTSYPRAQYKPGEMVKVSWISIPQVAETYAVKGGQPWWGFGFEMGMNEYGVCAGNEALGTKIPTPTNMLDKSLTGMDLLRLSLERGKTAYEAMHVVISLMEKYGQFGRCSADPKSTSTYGNSYMFADSKEAWVLETGGSEWIAKKVVDVWTIDNICTIEDDYDEISPGLIKMAIEKKWYDPRDRFNWARNVGTENFSEIKYLRIRDMLKQKKGSIDVPFMMQVSRDRLDGTFMQGRYMPEHFYRHIDGTTDSASTAGVMLSYLRENLPDPIKYVSWINLASPTTSIFSPHYFVSDPPKELSIGNDQYDPAVPWWLFDTLDRMSRKNYETYTPVIRSVFAVEEKGLLVDTAMIEKEVIRLYKAGKTAEIKNLLTSFEAKNMKHQTDVAKAIAAAIRELHKVLPGNQVQIQNSESSDLRAGIDLW